MRIRTRRTFGTMLAALMMTATVGSAIAVTPQEVLPDKSLETRARDISAGLRCLVCQNQSIDDSDAPLAHDLRVLVRERLTAGDTDDQVREFVVDRYGQFVLLKPPFSPATLLLWFMPLLALTAAFFILRNSFRNTRASGGGTPGATPASSLTPDEQAALDALLKSDEATKG